MLCPRQIHKAWALRPSFYLVSFLWEDSLQMLPPYI